MERKPVYYGEYLQLDKILNAQEPESFKPGETPGHDEHLFITIHQAYELWFKQILFEAQSVIDIFNKPTINDNSPELMLVVHRLQRCVVILRVLVQQIDILETMTSMDFLEFRDLLRPASGFQSWQFKVLEAKLGLQYEDRHGQEYYISQLKQPEIDIIKNAEDGASLIQLVNNWLERMLFADETEFWKNETGNEVHNFWQLYEVAYEKSLSEREKGNIEFFRQVLYGVDENSKRYLSARACRSAIFIMLYRGYPLLELPFQLLSTLLEIDNQMANWRHRHINMVRNMIGTRIGTGGSTGGDYLRGAMDKHYIFKEIGQLTSFLIERSKLPKLPKALEQKLGYSE